MYNKGSATILALLSVIALMGGIFLLISKSTQTDNNLTNNEGSETIFDAINDAKDVAEKASNHGEQKVSDSTRILGTWRWQETFLNDGSKTIPKKSESFSITFEKDGKISGTTDCNSFFGSYAISENNLITFSPIGSTKMYCEGSQEQDFINAISNTSSFHFNGTNLIFDLKFDSGTVLLKKI